jgi:hypothetical protein
MRTKDIKDYNPTFNKRSFDVKSMSIGSPIKTLYFNTSTPLPFKKGVASGRETLPPKIHVMNK